MLDDAETATPGDTPKRLPPNAGKGRIKGVPNKTTAAVKQAILEAFENAGGVDYLTMVATADPKTFCALLAKVLPMEVRGEGGGAIVLQVVTGVPASPEVAAPDQAAE